MSGFSIFFLGNAGRCRDYFDAATMLDAACKFYALRGADFPIYLIREHE